MDQPALNTRQPYSLNSPCQTQAVFLKKRLAPAVLNIQPACFLSGANMSVIIKMAYFPNLGLTQPIFDDTC